MPANENEKEQEGLDHCEVGLDEKLGFGKCLLESEAVFLKEEVFLCAEIQFDLGMSASMYNWDRDGQRLLRLRPVM
jgi:hypothetical protein